MSPPGKTARVVALALAAMIVGVVVGSLVAARAPLWPTARRPLLEPWDGYWRQSASGGLERFHSGLECAPLPDHRLVKATLIAPDVLRCRYEVAGGDDGDVVLIELVHSPLHADALLRAAYPGRVSTGEERVSLLDGMAPGQRSTVRSTSAPTPGLDALVVRGARVTVEVTCLDFGGGIDVARCHATQAAFFSTWKGGVSEEAAPH